jgi:hypothetical protein
MAMGLDRRFGCTKLGRTVYQQDYIRRQLELFAAALAKVVRKRREGATEQALDETRKAYLALGVDADLLRLDARSLVKLVGTKEKLAALCELLEEEAAIMDALSKTASATRLRKQVESIREVMAARAE